MAHVILVLARYCIIVILLVTINGHRVESAPSYKTTATSQNDNKTDETKPPTTTTPTPTTTTTTTMTPTTDLTTPKKPPPLLASGVKKLTKAQRIALANPNCPSLENADDLTQAVFLSYLTHECRYDKLTKPDEGGDPLVVKVQMDIHHIEASEHLQFKMHMLLQFRYTDNRLDYRNYTSKRTVMVGEELLRDKIWIPHITIANERESTVMGNAAKDVYVSISPKGEVIFAHRMKATVYCWMDLKKFPFDEQTCDVIFRSWTYNMSKMILEWEKINPVQVAHQLHLTEYALINYSTHMSFQNESMQHGAFVGAYSSLIFKFKIAREIGFYILDYFIPSIMLVCISWVTFWLQADAAPARVTLGTATMLAFITLAAGQSRSLPKVSYIKASEIWFMACAVFIFGSMVEFAFVNIIWRRRSNVELKKVNSKYIFKSTLTPKLARKELQRAGSMRNLQKSHSCSSLDESGSIGSNNISKSSTVPAFNNYLTVHSFPSNLNLPTIITQSEEDLARDNHMDSVLSIPVPEQGNQNLHNAPSWTTMTPQQISQWIDKRSRIAFPLAFLVFNIFYWSFVYGL